LFVLAIALALTGPVRFAAAEGPYDEIPPPPETEAQAMAKATGKQASDTALSRVITPYAIIVGGMRYERLFLREGEDTQARSPTLAVSRIGMRGTIGKNLDFESEFEANLGGGLANGSSVWEGQAQMSVRNQFLRYRKAGASVAVGRISDDATIDFFSAHVADLLLLDFYTRWPLIFSGGDRGTGVVATYDATDELTLGVTFHSTNPTGLTGSYQIGGALFPFTRPFGLAAAQVGRSSGSQPDTSLHMYFGTLSAVGKRGPVEVKLAMQGYQLDTQMSSSDDERINGYNLRASVRGKLHAKVNAWLNASRNENEMLDPMDAKVKLPDTYSVYTFSTGVDFNYRKRNGVGLQYAQTRQKEGMQHAITEHYVNLGTTYWVNPNFSLGARYGWYMFDDHERDLTGHSSLFVSGRLIL
jgi:hypothetical protein